MFGFLHSLRTHLRMYSWEIRAFTSSSCTLSWIQLQMMACPFGLGAFVGDTKHLRNAALFSSIPEELRRRIFVLTAQFFELTNDVKQMTPMLTGEGGYLSMGR